MAPRKMMRRRKKPSTRKLSSIETTLKKLDRHMNSTKRKVNRLDRVVTNLEFNGSSRANNSYNPFRKSVRPAGLPGNPSAPEAPANPVNPSAGSGGFDLNELLKVLKNPTFQQFFQMNPGNSPAPSNPAGSNAGGGFSITELLKLLQDPTIQSILKRLG